VHLHTGTRTRAQAVRARRYAQRSLSRTCVHVCARARALPVPGWDGLLFSICSLLSVELVAATDGRCGHSIYSDTRSSCRSSTSYGRVRPAKLGCFCVKSAPRSSLPSPSPPPPLPLPLQRGCELAARSLCRVQRTAPRAILLRAILLFAAGGIRSKLYYAEKLRDLRMMDARARPRMFTVATSSFRLPVFLFLSYCCCRGSRDRRSPSSRNEP